MFWQITHRHTCSGSFCVITLFVPPLQEKMPLAVVGSNVVIEVNGKKVRGRQYPWGVAEGRFARVRRHKGGHGVPLVAQGPKSERSHLGLIRYFFS